jgi:glc operon protein GlcG
MHTRVLAGLALAAALTIGGAQAQQPPAANPLDNIPDQMPFNVPYGAPITAERARAALNTAAEEAKKRGWPMNISVVDSGGNLVAFERMDGAQLASIAISQHKARTAVKFRRETKALEAGVQGGNMYLVTLDDVVASRGGIPLVEGGKMIGAIGVSGGTGSQDEVIAKAGAGVVNK